METGSQLLSIAWHRNALLLYVNPVPTGVWAATTTHRDSAIAEPKTRNT